MILVRFVVPVPVMQERELRHEREAGLGSRSRPAALPPSFLLEWIAFKIAASVPSSKTWWMIQTNELHQVKTSCLKVGRWSLHSAIVTSTRLPGLLLLLLQSNGVRAASLFMGHPRDAPTRAMLVVALLEPKPMGEGTLTCFGDAAAGRGADAITTFGVISARESRLRQSRHVGSRACSKVADYFKCACEWNTYVPVDGGIIQSRLCTSKRHNRIRFRTCTGRGRNRS